MLCNHAIQLEPIMQAGVQHRCLNNSDIISNSSVVFAGCDSYSAVARGTCVSKQTNK